MDRVDDMDGKDSMDRENVEGAGGVARFLAALGMTDACGRTGGPQEDGRAAGECGT